MGGNLGMLICARFQGVPMFVRACQVPMCAREFQGNIRENLVKMHRNEQFKRECQ